MQGKLRFPLRYKDDFQNNGAHNHPLDCEAVLLSGSFFESRRGPVHTHPHTRFPHTSSPISPHSCLLARMEMSHQVRWMAGDCPQYCGNGHVQHTVHAILRMWFCYSAAGYATCCAEYSQCRSLPFHLSPPLRSPLPCVLLYHLSRYGMV